MGQMMKFGDQFAAFDFFLVDFAVSEQYRTLDEVLKPAVVGLGGDQKPVPLTLVCHDPYVKYFFQATMGGANWDFSDFASYFHAHSDVWDYDPKESLLRL